MCRNEVENDGFGIFPGIIDPAQIKALLDALGKSDLHRTRAGARHMLRHPAVSELANSPEVLGLARSIAGPNATPFKATLFDKSPASNWLVVWHQDTALPLREKKDAPGWGPWSVKDGFVYAHAPASVLESILALRVHLDDSTAENGPLRVLPGTHKLGLLNDDDVHGLSGRTEHVNCLSPAGGVVAMRPLVVHASSKSASETPRRVLHIEYATSMTTPDGLELAIA